MQDVNLLAPAAAAGDGLPTMDSLEFQDIAHTTPSRKAPAPAAEIPLHDMKDPTGSAAFGPFDPKDVPLGQPAVVDHLHGEQHGLLAAAPGGPGAAVSALNMAIAGAAVSAAVSAVERKDPSAGASFYQLAYYRTHFDVTTAQIGSRLLRAFVPTGSYFYADTAATAGDAADDKPDLYGPFWIATTLVFLMAATGNFAEFLATSAAKVWNYDMEKMTVAATVFYSFIFPVPLVLWAYMRYIDTSKSLVTIISLYGYSLLWYLPVCVVCVAPIEWLRYLAVSLAAAASTRFLLRNLAYFGPNLTPDQPASAVGDEPTGGDAANSVPSEKKHKLFVALCVVAVFHLGLAAVTKWYFFASSAFDAHTTIDNASGSTGAAAP